MTLIGHARVVQHQVPALAPQMTTLLEPQKVITCTLKPRLQEGQETKQCCRAQNIHQQEENVFSSGTTCMEATLGRLISV